MKDYEKEYPQYFGCGHQETEPHPCPFKAELDNDYETLCTCCEACKRECFMDV